MKGRRPKAAAPPFLGAVFGGRRSYIGFVFPHLMFFSFEVEWEKYFHPLQNLHISFDL